MFTIFSVPKPFVGEFAKIQEKAIKSWLKIKPTPEIILLGDEVGIGKICKKYRLLHILDIKKNQLGTPLLDDIFSKAKSKARYSVLMYINADILLPSNTGSVINSVKKRFKDFLCVGQRYLTKKIKGPDWSDYFIFTKNVYKKIPPFAIGRTFWDKWLIWYALNRGFPVIDVTKKIKAVHQSHPYNKNAKNIWEGKEALMNLKLAGGFSHGRAVSEIKEDWLILTKYRLISIFDRVFFLYPLFLKMRYWNNKFRSSFPKGVS